LTLRVKSRHRQVADHVLKICSGPRGVRGNIACH
jgi:hypothetical protein